MWQIIKSVIFETAALYVPRRFACCKPIQHFLLHIQRATKRKRALWRFRRYADGIVLCCTSLYVQKVNKAISGE